MMISISAITITILFSGEFRLSLLKVEFCFFLSSHPLYFQQPIDVLNICDRDILSVVICINIIN